MQDQTITQSQEQIERNEKQLSKVDLRKSCSKNMQQICRGTPMPKSDFMSDFMAWVFSCKFAADFRNTFS